MLAPTLLAVELVAFLGWCVIDARAAFDGDPGTHTASELIKRWVKERPWHRLVLGLVLLDAAGFLILHLVLQVV